MVTANESANGAAKFLVDRMKALFHILLQFNAGDYSLTFDSIIATLGTSENSKTTETNASEQLISVSIKVKLKPDFNSQFR